MSWGWLFVEQWVKCLLWPISLWKSNKASSRSWKKIWFQIQRRVFDDEGEVWGCNGVAILMKPSTRGENCLFARIPAIFVVCHPHQCSQHLSHVLTDLQNLPHRSLFYRDFSSPFKRSFYLFQPKNSHKISPQISKALKSKVKWPGNLMSSQQVLQGSRGKSPKGWAKLEHWGCTEEGIQWLLENNLSWSLPRMIACSSYCSSQQCSTHSQSMAKIN